MSPPQARSRDLGATIGRAARPALIAGIGALVVNIVVWSVAALAGVDFEVTWGSTAPIRIGLVAVTLATILPIVIGGVILALTAPRSARAPTILAWLGLAIGVLTAAMPLAVQADPGTKIALATMHLVTGIVWWLTLRQQSRQPR